MAKGDGSIIEKKRGIWEVQVSAGVNPITKERQRKTKTIHGTKADARKARNEMTKELENGLKVNADKITFREFSETWLESRKVSGTVGKTTAEKDRYAIANLNKYLGEIALHDIDPQTVDALYRQIKKDKEEAGKPFSGTSLNHLHTTLKQIMKQAVNYDFILRNPCDRVNAPKPDEPERRSLSIEEGAKLLDCLNTAELNAYIAIDKKECRQTERGNLFGRTYLRGLNIISSIIAVRIGLATGMRRGEVLGLTWEGINIKTRHISVVQTLTSAGELKPPKSHAGIRTISIDLDTAKHIESWKKRQSLELLKIGIKQNNTTPVVCNEKGTWLEVHGFERWWRAFSKDNGFTGLKFHELRHTQATQLLANGVDVKTVQTRLGHSNPAITLGWYAHAIPENDEKAADLVGSLFSKKENEATNIVPIKSA